MSWVGVKIDGQQKDDDFGQKNIILKALYDL
jgi:hypothetical protein